MTPFDLTFLLVVISLFSIFLDRRWQVRRSRQPQAGEDTPRPPKRPGWRQRRAIKKAEREAAYKAAEAAAQQFVAAENEREAAPPEGLSWRERRAWKQEQKQAARRAAKERAAILKPMGRRERRAFKKAAKEATRKTKEEKEAARRAAKERTAALESMSWRERRAFKKAEKAAQKTSSVPDGTAIATGPDIEPLSEQPGTEPRQAWTVPETVEQEKVDLFSTTIAVLIGLVMLAGGWLAWDIGATYAHASSEQSAGVNALLNVESTLANNSVALYKEYRVFTEYVRRQTLADLQAQAGEESPNSALAAVQLPFFLTRYLTREGNYDRERQLGEAWAEAEQRLDLDPAPHFSAVETWQRKTELLIALFVPLVLALLVLTVAEALSQRRRLLSYAAGAIGALILILTVLAKFWIEIG